MDTIFNLKYIGGAVLYSVLGLAILGLAFAAFDRMTPGNLWKELIDEHNVALAIVVGSVMLALSIIIASAIHG